MGEMYESDLSFYRDVEHVLYRQQTETLERAVLNVTQWERHFWDGSTVVRIGDDEAREIAGGVSLDAEPVRVSALDL